MKVKDLKLGKLYNLSYIEDERNPGDVEVDYVGSGRLIEKMGSLYKFDIGFGEVIWVNPEHIISQRKEWE
jgi:hypothetical protein